MNQHQATDKQHGLIPSLCLYYMEALAKTPGIYVSHAGMCITQHRAGRRSACPQETRCNPTHRLKCGCRCGLGHNRAIYCPGPCCGPSWVQVMPWHGACAAVSSWTVDAVVQGACGQAGCSMAKVAVAANKPLHPHLWSCLFAASPASSTAKGTQALWRSPWIPVGQYGGLCVGLVTGWLCGCSFGLCTSQPVKQFVEHWACALAALQGVRSLGAHKPSS